MKGEKRVERLKPRLQRLYQALSELEKGVGAPPSVREIVRHLGLEKRFISRVHGDLNMLEQLGLVERLPIPTRRFRVNGPSANEINWEELLL